MAQLPDTRVLPLVVYDRRFLFWWGLALFFLKLGSRRQLDFDLRDDYTEVLANLNRLSGTDQQTLPVHGTLDHFLGHVGHEALAELRNDLVRDLIRNRVLDHAKLLSHFVVALDGTWWLRFHDAHCAQCLTQKQGDSEVHYHAVLEAKLLGPAGTAFSIATGFLEKPKPTDETPHPGVPTTDIERLKAASELGGFARLAPGLKRAYPQMAICISGDSQFACGTGLQIVQEHGWQYVFTFKEGRTPELWREFEILRDCTPENRLERRIEGGTEIYRWVEGLRHVDDQKRVHTVNAIECRVTKGDETTLFAWITGLPVNHGTVVAIANQGGRDRWRIENQGFNTQKNSALNLEHAYSKNPDHMPAYYYLLQIAHMILQLVEKGSLLKRLAKNLGKTVLGLFGSLKNIARRLLEVFRGCVLPDEAFAADLARGIQIRLNSS